jgi:hypothetical protein
MGMRLWIANALVLAGMAWMGIFSGVEVGAARVLPPAAPATPIADLEARAALAPANVADIAALASAYLDRQQPGLATAVIEKAPAALRERPEIAQLYARALFHRGRAREALAVARDASDTCMDSSTPCPSWLVAKTARQVAFFEQVVAAGIDDPQDDPGATVAAYERSTHEVRLVAMR